MKQDKKKKKITEASKYELLPASSLPANIHRGSTRSKSRSSIATSSHKLHGRASSITSSKHRKIRLASSSSDKFIQQMADLIVRYVKVAHNKMEHKRMYAALRNMVDEDLEYEEDYDKDDLDLDHNIEPPAAPWDEYEEEQPLTDSSELLKRSLPRVDVLENDDRIVIECECPGFSKEDLSVELKGDPADPAGTIICIMGTRRRRALDDVTTTDAEEQEEEVVEETRVGAAGNRMRYLRRERFLGSFVREFRLPPGVRLKLEEIASDFAKLECGVLTVELTKEKLEDRRSSYNIPIH